VSGWKGNEAPVGRVVLPQITAALGAPLPVQCAMPCPPLTQDSFQDLLVRFAAIRDPRHPRGIRHHVQAILAIAAVAVICGARSFAAIGEWAGDAPQWVLEALSHRPILPDWSSRG
jgi:DDE_Tnp_1-associated